MQADFILRDVLYRIALRWHADPIGLFLSGSAAPGNATEDSDIDLLQAMKPEVKITRSLYRIWDEFCKEHAGAPDRGIISPHFVVLPGSYRFAGSLWCETALEGIVLWERGRMVSRFLASVRKAMGQGKSVDVCCMEFPTGSENSRRATGSRRRHART